MEDVDVLPIGEKLFREDLQKLNNPAVERLVRSTQNQMKIEIPSIGTGVMRISCSWIVMMLMAENSKLTQEQVIVEALRQLAITPEDIAKQYHDKMCDQCGMSLRVHKDNNGECF